MQTYVSYTSTIQVNGTSLVYHVEGVGRPILLLHGNSGSHQDLHTLQMQLAMAGYTVYGIDSRGQGANPPLDEYHYKDMAEDVYQFIRKLDLHWPAIYGWSDGGITAFILELIHPGTCCVLAVSGVNMFPSGVKEGVLPPIIPGIEEPPLIRMMQYEPNISASDLRKITLGVLVTMGENDAIKEEHVQFIAENLPNGELCVVPEADHSSYVYNCPTIGHLVIDFLHRKNFY
ncbi:MAG: alpha/beta hydrolase [Bacteroidaceae bacterium]|nr:alpha/beta hydrolase [Bacteroidaceae bacterium]MCF0187318.1 alpha/beta hydrolase [Bacteroidaceae bacterium]